MVAHWGAVNIIPVGKLHAFCSDGMEEYYNDPTRTEESMFKKLTLYFYDSLKYKTIGGRTVYGGGESVGHICLTSQVLEYIIPLFFGEGPSINLPMTV